MLTRNLDSLSCLQCHLRDETSSNLTLHFWYIFEFFKGGEHNFIFHPFLSKSVHTWRQTWGAYDHAFFLSPFFANIQVFLQVAGRRKLNAQLQAIYLCCSWESCFWKFLEKAGSCTLVIAWLYLIDTYNSYSPWNSLLPPIYHFNCSCIFISLLNEKLLVVTLVHHQAYTTFHHSNQSSQLQSLCK